MDSKSEASAKKEDESAKDNPEGPAIPADQTKARSNKRKLSTTDVSSKRPKMEVEGMNKSSRGPDSAHGEKMVLRRQGSMQDDKSTKQILNASTSSSEENTSVLKVRKVKSHGNNDDMGDRESDTAFNHKGKIYYKCIECSKSFDAISKLHRHFETHTGEHLVQCHICYKVISSSTSLRRHMKSKHPGSTSSPERSEFQYSNAISAVGSGHMICLYPSCGKQISKREMQIHVYDNEGVKPYKCSHCPKTFAYKLGREAHAKTHTGELVVQCRFCHTSFSHKWNLKKHKESVHSAEMGHSGTRSKANLKRTGLRKKNKRGINDANTSESKADECSGSSSFDSSLVDQQPSTSSHLEHVRRVQRQCCELDGTSVVERQLLNSFLPKNLDILDFSLPKEYLNKADMQFTPSEEKPNNSQVPKDNHRLNVEFKCVSMYVAQDKEELQSFEIVAPVILNHVSANHTQIYGQDDKNITMDPTNAKQEEIDRDFDLLEKQSTKVLPDDEINDISSSMDDINNNERAVESFDDVKDDPDDGPDAVVEPEQKLQFCETIKSNISNIVHTVTEQNRIHDEIIPADSRVTEVEIRDTVRDKAKTCNVDKSEGGPNLGIISTTTCPSDDINNIVKSEEEDDLKPESPETVVPVGAKHANELLENLLEPNNNNMVDVSNEPKLEDMNMDFDLPNGKVDKNKDDTYDMFGNNIKEKLDKPYVGNKNKLKTGSKTVLETSANVTSGDDIVFVYESKPPTEESQHVDDDCASIRSGPVFREHYPDDFSSVMSTSSDLYQADDEHTDCAAELEAINKVITSSCETRSMAGTSQYFIERFKCDTDTLHVVWHKDFNLDVARSVAANSSKTMLVVQNFDSRQFDLVRLFGSSSQNIIYVGDQEQQELRCFLFGNELLAHRSDTKFFSNFEEVGRELTTFASSHSKSLLHIVEQDWTQVTKAFENTSILAKKPV